MREIRVTQVLAKLDANGSISLARGNAPHRNARRFDWAGVALRFQKNKNLLRLFQGDTNGQAHAALGYIQQIYGDVLAQIKEPLLTRRLDLALERTACGNAAILLWQSCANHRDNFIRHVDSQ